MKTLLLVIAVALPISGLAFDVRGIEPGKTTEKEAIKIVVKVAYEGDAKYHDQVKGDLEDGAPWKHCRPYSNLPAGSPLKGYKHCAMPWRYKNERGSIGSVNFGVFSLANVPGHPVWRVDSKGVLQSFEFIFASKKFEELKTAAIAKWGHPAKRELGPIQNRMGATFDNEVLMWKSEKGTVWLFQRNENVDLGLLMVYSKQFIDDDDKDTALRKTQKRRDF